MTPEQRKTLARQLKDNELLHEILASADAGAVARWRSAKSPQAREECWQSVQAVATISRNLTNAIEALLK